MTRFKHQERFGEPNPATCRWRRQGALTRKKVDVRESDLPNEKISTELSAA